MTFPSPLISTSQDFKSPNGDFLDNAGAKGERHQDFLSQEREARQSADRRGEAHSVEYLYVSLTLPSEES